MTIPSIGSVPYGTCHCGCGGKTSIAKRTVEKFSHITGEPMRYICGHHRAHGRPNLDGATPFKIDGVYCRLIPLTHGMYAIVDEADYGWLSKFRWCALWSEGTKSFYAVRNLRREGDGRKQVSMHREILGLKRGDPYMGDHIESGHTWDNRRKNLREATNEGNGRNERLNAKNSTGYKGVSWHLASNAYRAVITVNRKQIHLGTRDTAHAAHEELYIPAALRYHQDFANDGTNWQA